MYSRFMTVTFYGMTTEYRKPDGALESAMISQKT